MDFYFCYGTQHKYPFVGGHTKVSAKDREDAVCKFKAKHVDRKSGCVNCENICSEENWKKVVKNFPIYEICREVL